MKKFILLFLMLSGCATFDYNISDTTSITHKSQIDFRYDGHNVVIPKYNQLIPILGTYSDIGISYDF